MRRIDDILKEVPIWKNASNLTCELISVSSNYTYIVKADDLEYILRIDGDQKDFLKLNKKSEVRAIQKAADLGISPKIYSSESDLDYLVTEYISGEFINDEQFHSPDTIKAMAEMLVKIHQINGVDRDCSPFYMLSRYLDGIKSLKVELPEGFTEILKNVDEIEKRSVKNSIYTKKYCHNDYFTFNMIKTDNQIFVIDWELSGFGDIFFDLSTISFAGNYSELEDELLLKSYFGYHDDEHKILLHDMKYMNMLRDIGWLLLHAGLDKEHAADYFIPTAKKAIQNVHDRHLHFRCNCT